MAEDGDVLQVQPTELKFKFELRKNIPVILSLTNKSSTEKVAFKVKTTSPKSYCVRPSSGFVEPNSTLPVSVIRQAQKEMPTAFGETKDKFLVQSVRVPVSVTDITPDIFDVSKSSGVTQVKLRVSLSGPPQPPSPVPEGLEDDVAQVPAAGNRDGTQGVTMWQSNGAAGGEYKEQVIRLQQKYERADAERQELRNQLMRVSGGGQNAGLSWWVLLVVAFVAFLSGYFLK